MAAKKKTNGRIPSPPKPPTRPKGAAAGKTVRKKNTASKSVSRKMPSSSGSAGAGTSKKTMGYYRKMARKDLANSDTGWTMQKNLDSDSPGLNGPIKRSFSRAYKTGPGARGISREAYSKELKLAMKRHEQKGRMRSGNYRSDLQYAIKKGKKRG